MNNTLLLATAMLGIWLLWRAPFGKADAEREFPEPSAPEDLTGYYEAERVAELNGNVDAVKALLGGHRVGDRK